MEYDIKFGEEAENYCEQCAKIFDENNKGYIVNRSGIFDFKKFKLLVMVQDGIVVAYQLIYFGGDFVKQETYEEAYNNGFRYENDAVYIWDMCSKVGYENKGFQQKLIMFLSKSFENRNIYSLTDVDNLNSVHLQEKCGFKGIGNFVGHHGETYVVLKKDKKK